MDLDATAAPAPAGCTCTKDTSHATPSPSRSATATVRRRGSSGIEQLSSGPIYSIASTGREHHVDWLGRLP
eukprot:scaffold7991_cov106-Isochrysis_galbana.AAC.5